VATAGSVPALAHGEAAGPADASFVVYDDGFRDGAQGDPNDNTVEIAPGGTVSFSYLTGGSSHNVVFGDGDTDTPGAQPSSCTQTAGAVILAAPPLPSFPLPSGWAGTCTFNTAGTYTFYCKAHPTTMKGTVIVGDTGTPTPTATATVTAEPTPVATPVVTPAPTPQPWASLDAPAKKAASVKALASGKLKLSARCSTPSSGTLSLTVSKADAKRLKLKRTELVRTGAQCTGVGRLSVTLRPSAAVRRALKRWKRALKTTATLSLGNASSSRAITLARAR
jgi:plastocyanin